MNLLKNINSTHDSTTFILYTPDSTDAPLTEKQLKQLDNLLKVKQVIQQVKKGPAQFNRQLVRLDHQVTKLSER